MFFFFFLWADCRSTGRKAAWQMPRGGRAGHWSSGPTVGVTGQAQLSSRKPWVLFQEGWGGRDLELRWLPNPRSRAAESVGVWFCLESDQLATSVGHSVLLQQVLLRMERDSRGTCSELVRPGRDVRVVSVTMGRTPEEPVGPRGPRAIGATGRALEMVEQLGAREGGAG